ncbi:MAG: glycosyltransferase, partial [Oligoflexia bacterium]|nr:glycosyltransferase [Oligoflexia bacterium]
IILAVHCVLNSFVKYEIDGEIIIVNDGSTDKTKEYAICLSEKNSNVKLLNHKSAMGIGRSFFDGVKSASKEVVVMFPGDNENDPEEALRYLSLINQVDIVVPFIHNVEVRNRWRRLISTLYRFIINISFGVNLNYTNGTVFYRRVILEDVELKGNGFFYQAEILVKLIRKGYLFAEVPNLLKKRLCGKSKATTLSSLLRITKNYLSLVYEVHFKRIESVKGYKKLKIRNDVENFSDDVYGKSNKIILDGHKLDWHKDRVESWLRGEKIAPITIDMALTDRCSYNCQYCFGKLQHNEGHKLDRDTLFRFLEDAKDIGVKAISLVSDGESTLSSHFYDFIIYGKKLGLDMAVGTNGFALDTNRLGEILPLLTYLRINISAGTPSNYARIHGVSEDAFFKVINNIHQAVKIKRKNSIDVTIGLQMVLLPSYADEIMPLTNLGKALGVDYLVIKHCSNDEKDSLNIDYNKYDQLQSILKEAERESTKEYLVKAKWSKILSKGIKNYSECYGPPFILQISGTGLVAPCGFLFNQRFKDKFHIGNIAKKSFKEIWQSDRYWQVMKIISSSKYFDVHHECGTLCLQHIVNEYLWDIKLNHNNKNNPNQITKIEREKPVHVNFI